MFNTRRPTLTLMTGLLMVGAAHFAVCQTQTDFNWPMPVVHSEPQWNVYNLGILGVRAVVPPAVREKLRNRKYTPEEHRNVQTAIDEMSKSRDTPAHRSKDARPALHSGFYVLHGAFGYPKRNGFSAMSFMSRVQDIEDIIADGNRLALVFRITGSIAGPMYGFKGIGQRIDMRESMKVEFDEQGLIVASQPWSAEDLAFYQQLGGKLEFGGPAIPAGPLQSLPQGASDRALLERLTTGSYSNEERRNVKSVLAALADPGGFEVPNPKHFSKRYQNSDTSAYFTLLAVDPKAGGFKVSSLKGLTRQATDFLVNDDRVWVHVLNTGTQVGPLFGVPASGKALSWNEEIYVTMDRDGKIIETTRYPVQGELYQQLGGKFTFPYAQYWKCEGCPNSPGRATLEIPGESQ